MRVIVFVIVFVAAIRVIVALMRQSPKSDRGRQQTLPDVQQQLTGSGVPPRIPTDAPAPPPTRVATYDESGSLESPLETTLDVPIPTPAADAGLQGPRVIPLSPEMEQRVLDLMRQNNEVGAVRLLCDELNIGILDAQKTVRTLAGLPTIL